MAEGRVNFAKEDIGGEILPILTTGLYRNTFDALREYIQNGIDAKAHNITITINPDIVAITDDGQGMANEQARNAIRFGVSNKNPYENIGFRGIGIYSAFNMCNLLEIHTKSADDTTGYKLSFDFFGIRRQLLLEQARRTKGLPPALHLERLLEESVFMEPSSEASLPGTGTKALMTGLLPSAYLQLNDWVEVTEYLSNVVPLPFSPAFRHGPTIEQHFKARDHRVVPLKLQLGDRDESLYRPYTDDLFTRRKGHEPAFFEIKSTGGAELGFAWTCVNDARETIKDVKVRGLLLKKFGFSISDRRYLEPFFGRPLYSRRITGELIATHDRLIPNAARSDFENNAARQSFLTQLPKLTRTIDRWADNIQETERAKEVLTNRVTELLDITSHLPEVQRDREALLQLNARFSEIARQMRPHKKRLEKQEPEGILQYATLLSGAEEFVRTALTQNRRSIEKVEQQATQAAQREAAVKSSAAVMAMPQEEIDISSLVQQYLPLDQAQWLDLVGFLDRKIVEHLNEPNAYHDIVGDLKAFFDG